eukprot:jgi/Psemu1/318643/estExt_fgenesh1_pm.C_1010016
MIQMKRDLKSIASASAAACPLWLAPSYITEQSASYPKFGLYAGRNYEQNSTLPLSELAIPLIDFFEDQNRRRPLGSKVLPFLEDYMWTQDKLGSHWEGHFSAPGIVPGVGILANFHSTYSNADFLQASVLLREPGEEFPKAGEASLMRGAVTPYFNATLRATQTIPAGMEIFADFGDVWDGNFTENIYQDKIHRYDYHLADELVKRLVELYDKHPDLSLDMKEDVMDFLLEKVLTTVAGPNAKTIHSLIPANPRKLRKILDSGGTFMYRYRDMIRSEEWLETNGFCLDAIRQGVSNIPNAGRGAFANRHIAKGETITITPLLHIANKHLLNMYKVDNEDDENGPTFDESNELIGQQLVLNYAFGHPDSSMVFVPTGPQVTLINNGGSKSSNARIEWADSSDDVLSNPEIFLGFTMEEMAELHDTVLVMKIVAKQDIREGEEITINYGASWQKAWDAYEQDWKQNREGKPHPLKAQDLRNAYKKKPFETSETLPENPLPEDVVQACFVHTRELPDGMQMIHQEHGTEMNQFESPNRYEDYDSKSLYFAEVLDRREAPGFFYNYTVRVTLGPEENEFADVHDVPHAACTFFDQTYTSDIHLDGAFRHPIGMPDAMVPQAWRNMAE